MSSRISWYETDVPRGFKGVFGKKRVLVCTSCSLGPCLEGKPKCIATDGNDNLGTGAKSDWYQRGDDTVSVEDAAETELRLKQDLDDDVEYENVHSAAPHERQAPCRRRKGSFHS